MKLSKFVNCKSCIVRSNCSSICDEYIEYVYKETNIALSGMFLETAENIIKSIVSCQRPSPKPQHSWEKDKKTCILTIQMEE